MQPLDGFDPRDGDPIIIPIVSDSDLANPLFIRDVREFVAALRIPRRRMIDWLADGYRNASATLVDKEGNRAFLDFDQLDREGVADWFKDWCKRPQPQTRLHVRHEAKERVRVMATILILCFPKAGLRWGEEDPKLPPP